MKTKATKDRNPAAVELGRLGGLAKSERKAQAVRENAKKGGRPRSRYTVYLYGRSYKHTSLKAAGRRLIDAQEWCNGEHAQCIDTDGTNVTDEAWKAASA